MHFKAKLSPKKAGDDDDGDVTPKGPRKRFPNPLIFKGWKNNLRLGFHFRSLAVVKQRPLEDCDRRLSAELAVIFVTLHFFGSFATVQAPFSP